MNPYIELYALHVFKGWRTIESVPEKIREEVLIKSEQMKEGEK